MIQITVSDWKVFLSLTAPLDDDEHIRLSRRVLSQSDGHVEVCSDLDDQGVFLIRDDLVKWIMRNAEAKGWCSIRDEMVPAILKNQYRGDILSPFHQF